MLAIIGTVLVNFATNRARVSDNRIFGPEFDQEHIYVLGTIEVDRVSLQSDPNSLKLEGPPKARDNSQLTLSRAASKEDDGSLVARFASQLAQHQKDTSRSADNGGLLFIHGYNNTFLDSMTAAADLVLKYDLSHVFCFSWPSYGDWLNYKGDQAHAQQSAPAVGSWFANMLAQLSDKDPLLQPRACLERGGVGCRAQGPLSGVPCGAYRSSTKSVHGPSSFRLLLLDLFTPEGRTPVVVPNLTLRR